MPRVTGALSMVQGDQRMTWFTESMASVLSSSPYSLTARRFSVISEPAGFWTSLLEPSASPFRMPAACRPIVAMSGATMSVGLKTANAEV